jgi:hypothetical protein
MQIVQILSVTLGKVQERNPPKQGFENRNIDARLLTSKQALVVDNNNHRLKSYQIAPC